jgi:hypothetical protein
MKSGTQLTYAGSANDSTRRSRRWRSFLLALCLFALMAALFRSVRQHAGDAGHAGVHRWRHTDCGWSALRLQALIC